MDNVIVIKGAKENNLKDFTLSIPKNKLVVLTGPSGSGKSTLAMDTLFKECQRQYLESMGLQGIEKPNVDSIRGLSPAISVNQQVTNRNPRSTVGTVTDMYTSLRMIFEKIGRRQCPACRKEMMPTSNGCPYCRHRMDKLTRSHFSYNTTEGACQTCKGLGDVVNIHEASVFHLDRPIENGAVDLWKGRYADYQIPIVKAAMAYYGVPIGEALPLKEYRPVQKAILYFGVESQEVKKYFPNRKPPRTVAEGKFEGVLTGMWRRFSEKEGKSAQADAYFYSETCPDCLGDRLNPISRSVTVAHRTIPQLVNQSLKELRQWIEQLEAALDQKGYFVVEAFIQDLRTKLTRIIKVGLGYLTLDRQTISLSGGEAQRLRLAALLDSALTGVLYVMDEPTVGLHPKDTLGLVRIMKNLRDLGNTVLVIEHDLDVMREADYIIDMGPGAGHIGGHVVGEGTLTDLIRQRDSVTGRYLREEGKITHNYRAGTGEYISAHRATVHNLKNITVAFPAGCLTVVTGVSGSGKSSLIFDVLAKGNDKVHEGFERVTGLEHFDQVVTVGQSPLSRMKRSNVATYTDVFTEIRNVFARLKEAKEKKLTAKHFSFNTVGGRCEDCQGLGNVPTNMLFFPDMDVTCSTCKGRRFKQEILSVKYNGYTINDVLASSVENGLHLFNKEVKIKAILELLVEVGLGYLNMGQSLTTLSGGEGQRLKLARELMTKTNKRSLYLLDEPTTGLHPKDVQQLLKLLHRLVDAGNTVISVEHNSEFIRSADWIVDLGPEGGAAGGRVIAEGTPEAVANSPHSYTGQFIRFG